MVKIMTNKDQSNEMIAYLMTELVLKAEGKLSENNSNSVTRKEIFDTYKECHALIVPGGKYGKTPLPSPMKVRDDLNPY